jgi:hypothetical protein
MKDTKKSVVETLPEPKEEKLINSIPKMDFDSLEVVHNALIYAFHPDGLEEDEDVDDRLITLFTIFLASVGWSEEEYWEAIHAHEHICPNCGSHQDEDEFDEEEIMMEEAEFNKSKN